MQKFILLLTLLRIFSAPLILLLVILEYYWLAFWIFNLAAITDYYDGQLARKYNLVSTLGRILDPIADKALILFALISLILMTGDNHVALMAAFILVREFWISALREYVSENNLDTTNVSFLAKLKTTFQFLAIAMYFFGAASDISMISFLADFVLFLALFLGLKTALDYTQKTFRF